MTALDKCDIDLAHIPADRKGNQKMAMLIDVGHGGWMTSEEIRDIVLTYDGTLDVRTRNAMGDVGDVRMLAVSGLAAELPGLLPNLELVQKLGAGVETIVSHQALPDHVRVTRLRPDAPAREIAEYCLAYILREQRQMRFYETEQAARRWSSVEPRYTPESVVAVLGLGHIGGRTAGMLRDVGFQVMGWSRSPKFIDGVTCFHGQNALNEILGQADYVCAILPSTADTRGMFGPDQFAAMKPGSILINVGRGDLIDEGALMDALDTGPVAGAVLDVLSTEPLPPDDPLWAQPGVTITPHVSGWHLDDAFGDVAENYKRLLAGTPLLHEVDRQRGY